jgi:hypothetical protein
MKDLVDVHFPEAAVISVVLDNLNTHTRRRSIPPFGQRKPAAFCGNWIFTIRPSMAVG